MIVGIVLLSSLASGTGPDTASILETIEVRWNLQPLGTRDAAANDLAIITGQKPIITKSKKAISNFKLRIGMPIGIKVTLRGERMWHFYEKLVTVALPRIRDFQGIPERSFDGRGNFSLGLKEQLVFPEIEYDKIDRLRGMEITIVTTAKTDEEARALLKSLGMPFQQKAQES